jgi:hypothetical protein
MAYTAPGTAVAGDVLTAAFWNQQVRDNMEAVAGPPFARNIIYNGAMQIAQRGTSTASITTQGYYTADRWSVGINTHGTWTQSVENDAPTGSGFRKSLKMLCTTADASPAAADRILIQQPLEGLDLQRIAKGTSSAQELTLSFWVKSNVTGTYIASLYDNNNTRHVSKTYTISASATWEKKTITFPADTTGAFTNDNAASLYLVLYLGAGSNWTSGTLATSWASFVAANDATGQTNLAAATNNYWQVTGVQLETGSVATPFEFLPYGEDLRRCQRYYQRFVASTVYGRFAVGQSYSGTGHFWLLHFPTTMRIAPSSIDTTGLTAANFAITTNTGGTQALNTLPVLASTANTPNSAYMEGTTAAGGTTGAATMLIANNLATAFLGFSAEL